MALPAFALSSEPAAPSTPPTSDDAIFSDTAPHETSLPSSPPGFPWEQQTRISPTKPATSSRNAFSVLGKRKVLDTITENARPTKRPAPIPAKPHRHALTQMQISLGQETQKRCKDCGMEYIASSAEDRQLHDKYHRQHSEGCDVGKDFIAKARQGSVLSCALGDDAIVAVDSRDTVWRRRRVRMALDVVQRELGAVDIPDVKLWEPGRHIAYLYVRGTKCVGLLLAECITEAREVVAPARRQSTGGRTLAIEEKRPPTSLAALKARRTASRTPDETTHDPVGPLELAITPVPAKMGISRIWTSPTQRGQGIAIALLDRARSHFDGQIRPHESNTRHDLPPSEIMYGASPVEGARPGISKADVAFSQPTEMGARLARKWCGRTYGWLVYAD
ncbi:hypothetical protein B0A48_06995 [Cryoendolithus antarcticus]|uniref:N-acetyltransferase domain-containing protein n=1 Tax=Cryoendolithus antarcticus TaxID=1507870 RepID=A0A1V8TA16_9PEZI|nr:hypothetical protein B0A48_06995 [Cryoendolithus antarcticus]